MRDVTTGLLQPFGWGLGYPDWIDPASPAAGANFVHTVGGSHYERLIAATATVTTDANVANRFVSLDYMNARGVTYARNGAGLVLTASTSATVFQWNSARTVAEWAAGTPVLVPLMLAFCPPGFMWQITLDNIQVGDAITAVHLWVEKWPTGPRGYPQGMVTEVELLDEHELG